MVQSFEPYLTAVLAERFPQLLPEVLAKDQRRGWLLLADAGRAVRELGNRPEIWLDVLPLYAELQRRETESAGAHLAADVPDLRVEQLPQRFGELMSEDMPIDNAQRDLIRRLEARFVQWCAELSTRGVAATVQHEDLHYNNLFVRDGRPRILDWGDAVISHPFASLLVTFWFLEAANGLAPTDPWFGRLRDAYLEPWGPGHVDTFHLASRVGTVAHAIAWIRQRNSLPTDWRPRFDTEYRRVLNHVCRLAIGPA